ncbi:MAG TPA: FlgD immunoglobulin-like domain containing protein [Bacteroidota bacterium]|nr:FlgD immunoglobulin-like domain containing protein [Bacteroidota bacterium]
MKQSRLLLPLLATGAFVAGLLFIRSDAIRHGAPKYASPASVDADNDEGIAEAIGANENPNGREHYDWMRLHDPSTGLIPTGIRSKEIEFAATLPKHMSSGLAKGAGYQGASWVARGPYNVGGRTRAFAVDATNNSRILAGGVSGGMWVSTDGGNSWTRTTPLSDIVQSVTTIAQDKRSGKTSTWYYGTGELLGNSAAASGASYRGDGLFKSTDGGSSWTRLSSTSTNAPQNFDVPWDYIFEVATDPSNMSQDVVYAATTGAVMKSTDGGSTWSKSLGSSTTASGPRYSDVAVTSTGVVYAALSWTDVNITGTTATNAGISRSPDGVNWTNITPAGFPTQYSRIVIGLAPSDPTIVYFLVYGTNGTNGTNQINSHQFWKYTYGSGDGSGSGGTWVNRGQNLPNETGVSGNAVFDTQGGYDMLVRVKPDDPNFVVVGSTNLYRSTDGFASTSNWKRIGGYAGPSSYATYTNHHPDQHSGFFNPASSTGFFSGHDGGLTLTSDVTASTVSWSSLNNGYLTGQFYTIALDHGTSGDPSIVGGLQDNGTYLGTSLSLYATWEQMLTGDGGYAAFSNGGTYVYVSAQGGQTYELTSTSYVRIDPTGGSYGSQFIVPYILDPNNSNIMYLDGDKIIWRNNNLSGITVNASQNTTTTNWDTLGTVRGTGSVSTLAVSTSPANVLYYGTTTGAVYKMTGANTGSPTPANVTSGSFPVNAYVSCIAIDPSDANKAITVFSNYSVVSLFYTTNGGTSWGNISGNLEQNSDGSGNGPSCRWALIHRSGSVPVYYVGTSTGLYSTTALNGTSTVWAQEGAGTVGNEVVDMIDDRASDGTVVVATHGNGVFSATVVTAVAVQQANLPLEFQLKPNYPNPFNPSTTLEYTLRDAGHVRLSVYDEEGKQVAVLVDREESAGDFHAVWDGKLSGGAAASSGVYYARLVQSGNVSTRKMVLLK